MNLSWSEIYDIVRELTDKIETQKTVQKTIPRVNLKTLLQIMINFDTFTYDKKNQLQNNRFTGKHHLKNMEKMNLYD